MIYTRDVLHYSANRYCKLRKECYRYWLEKHRCNKPYSIPYYDQAYNRDTNKCENFIPMQLLSDSKSRRKIVNAFKALDCIRRTFADGRIRCKNEEEFRMLYKAITGEEYQL